MLDIVYKGIEGKFIPNDEFRELQYRINKQSLLIEELMLDLKKRY